MNLAEPVSTVPGVGKVREQQLAEAGISTVADLLMTLPVRFEDRRVATPLASLTEDAGRVLVSGRVSGLSQRTLARRGRHLVQCRLNDETGSLRAVWFNARWVAEKISNDDEITLFGRLQVSHREHLEIVNPEIEEEGGQGRLVPVYPSLGDINRRLVARLVRNALPALERADDPLPTDIRRSNGLQEIGAALRWVHDPSPDLEQRSVLAVAREESPAHRRLVFDELLAFSLGLERLREMRRRHRAPRCPVDDGLRSTAMELLPFVLTGAQKRVLRRIAGDLAGELPMARLLQGDVGSGKTVVAGMAALVVLANGHQVAVMAPTELLAEQHLGSFRKLFEGTAYEPSLLTGSLKAPQRRKVIEGLRTGEIRLVVGTHALIQDGVKLADLGLAVVDEQHRFGVAHRQALVSKGRASHLLVMTATPIPRSLALTLYGDLDLSIIDELPPGRPKVRTELRSQIDRDRVLSFLADEAKAGGRSYVVYALIDPSESIDAVALTSCVDTMAEKLAPHRTDVLHGRMSREEQESALRRFRSGEVRILLGTTVVEVGVDVPEATVMMIENAERFGLSQLHQLRGRVGRGRRRSWCVCLVGDHASDAARRRLELFASTNDGFELAESDLRMRGAGDFVGTQQWGPAAFRFVDPLRDHRMVAAVRESAREMVRRGDAESVRSQLARYHRTEFEVPAG